MTYRTVLLITSVGIVSTLLLNGSSGSRSDSKRQGGRYDEQIRAQLKADLRKDSRFITVDVEVEDGIVSLEGSVEKREYREEAAKRAWKIDHVQSVLNHLEVAPAPPLDRDLYLKICDALDRPGLHDLRVRVYQGKVTVWGSVRSEFYFAMALDIIHNTPGVESVDSQIHVVNNGQ
jgi:osmotically-inducible protein OsmY